MSSGYTPCAALGEELKAFICSLLRKRTLALLANFFGLQKSGEYSVTVMTAAQESKCHKIIHTAAVGAGAGNFIPVPGTGIAADMVAMSMMSMSLASVFGGSLTEEVAKGMAVAALKNTMLKQPIKVLTKELSKFVPFLGQVVGPAISVGMIESAGWALANDMAVKFNHKALSTKTA